MKYSYLLISVFICAKSIAQDSLYKHLPLEGGKVSYTRIIEVDSAKKDQLFTLIKDWAVDAYKSQKAAFQAEDKEAGYIAFKGYLPTRVKYHGGIVKGSSYRVDIYHTLKFYIKEGKVKIVFMDLESQSMDGGSVYLERNSNYTIPKVPVENWTEVTSAAIRQDPYRRE